MESANLLEGSFYCCCKCKGLFNIQDDKLKHQVNCMGNPMETTCAYFACERKIFLQLFQPEDFLLDGCDPPFWFSKDDSFVNHFVKIRVPDIFDPSIFLKSTSQPNQGDADDTNFLLESNINTLEEGSEKTNGNSFLDSSKPVDPIDQEQIQSIINKNIEYLKNDDIPSLSAEPSKVPSPFHQSQGLPRLLSPIDKHLHLFGDGSKSRLHSPFEKNAGFLQDGQVGYNSGSFMYSSNPSIPFSCGLSTDLFSSIQIPQDENPHGFPTNIEEFPTLKYLDLAKKDPFFGQNPGISQMNTKDPFLINAAFKATEKPSCSLQKSQITRSCEDLQSSPMLPIQDGNYFNFPSTLDEPTQLDYLDLATLDFLTNPNLISCGTGFFKEKLYERDDDIYSEGYLTDQEEYGVKSETAARLDAISVTDNGDMSAFSKVKKKQLRLKKSKSDIGKRHDSATPGNKSFFGGFSDVRDDFQQSSSKSSDNHNSIHPKRSRSLIESSDYRIGRKRKLDTPKECSSETKLFRMNRKSSELKKTSRSEKVFNEGEKLSHLTEEQKDSVKAVIGQSGCIFVKKKRSLSCDEPVVYVNDVQFFGTTDLFDGQNKQKGREDKYRSGLCSSKENFNEKCKTGKLTSVLQLKCLECDFRCRSVVELKNHRVIHTKKTEMEPDVIQHTNILRTTVSCIKNQTTTVMKPEHMNGSVIEIKGNADTDNASHLHCSVNTTVTSDINSGVLSEMDNTVISSVPVTECLSVYDNSVIICEATKEFVASQPKAVSLLPRKITDISLNCSNCQLENANSESICNSLNFVEPYNADMSKETAIAVQTIEDINSKYQTSDANEQIDACLSNGADTVNMAEKSRNDSNQENEMCVLNPEFRGVPIQNDKMDFDFECTAVPFQTYKTDVLLLDTGQMSAETVTADLIKKTSTGKDINKVIEDPEKLVRKFRSELNHLKQDFLFFEENKTADCLIREAEEKEESAKTELINRSGDVVLNDIVDLNTDYVNTERPGTHSKQLKVNVSVERRSTNVNCWDREEVGENRKNDHAQNASAVTDNCMHDYTKDIKKLEKVLGASSDETYQADDHSEDCTEHDYSETPHPNQVDAGPEEKIAGINRDCLENMNLKDNNCWTTLVRSISYDGEKECVHDQNFTHMEKKLDFKMLNIDQNPLHKRNVAHFKTSLPSEKEGSNERNLFQDLAVFDISSGITENKPILRPRLSQHMWLSALDLSEPSSSKECKNLEGEKVKLRYFTDGVVSQNVFVPQSNLMTKSDNVAFVSQDDIEYNESINKQRFGKLPKSETNSLSLLFVSEHVSEGNCSASDFTQGLEPKIILTDKDTSTGVMNVSQQNSSAAKDLLMKGEPRGEDDSEIVKSKAKPEVEHDNSTMIDYKNCNIGHERQNVIKETNVHVANSVSKMLVDNVFAKGSTSEETVSVAGRSDTAEINRSLVTVNPKLGEFRMQSLLKGNTVNISNVTGQLLKATVDPVQESGTENSELTLVKDFEHEEAKIYCNEKRSDRPVLEDQSDMDSANTDFINKDTCNEETTKQVKTSDCVYYCDVKGCRFKTLYKSNVSSHYQQVHLAVKRYMCDQCTYATPNLSCLKHHLQLNHYKEKRFKCPDCDYLSLFHSDIVKHVRHTHMKQKQFACNQCDYRTGHSHSLKLHIMSHSGIRPYKCNTCDYRASSSNKVRRHITLCHKNQVGVACEKQDVTFEIDVKQFQCEEVISYQDIKVIELSKEEADAIVKKQAEKREEEKKRKDSDKKAKEELKVMKAKQTVAKHLNKKSLDRDGKTSKDVNVIRLTPDAAKALMEAKSEKKLKNCEEETVIYTKVLSRPKSLVTKDDNESRSIEPERSDFINERNSYNIGSRLKCEQKCNSSLQPHTIKIEFPCLKKDAN